MFTTIGGDVIVFLSQYHMVQFSYYLILIDPFDTRASLDYTNTTDLV